VVEVYGFSYEVGPVITLTMYVLITLSPPLLVVSSSYPFICSIMEFMHCGSLFDMLHGKSKRALPLLMRLRMASQCSMAVAFLHENRIMHRDIKSLNIMVALHRLAMGYSHRADGCLF